MNELNMDELVYYKKDDNLYSGGFKIHSILTNSLHDVFFTFNTFGRYLSTSSLR
jgi:hypothetical protein